MKKALLFLVLLGFSSVFAQKVKTWMAIGSSSTYQNGKPEITKNRITEGYMDRVVEKLPYIHYVNHGHSGWTTKSIADNINNLGLEKADFYSILLGSNDWWTALPLGTFSDYRENTGNNTMYGSYRTIINKIKSLNSNATIVLMTPSQRTDYVDVNNKASFIYGCYRAKNGHFLSEYADVVKTIAKAEHFEMVDLYYHSGITIKNAVKYRRLRDPKTGEYKKYKYPYYTEIPYDPVTDDYPYPLDAIGMTFDGLHPSDKGYARVAKMLVKVMKKY